MARPRSFDEQKVVDSAAKIFSELGYNATSIDDLVKVTGLLRGSLYKAFASKAGLFESSLRQQFVIDPEFQSSQTQDLLIVALKEVAPVEPKIQKFLVQMLAGRADAVAQLLGQRLTKSIEEN
jgi:AcrR family transcriptional regulator